MALESGHRAQVDLIRTESFQFSFSPFFYKHALHDTQSSSGPTQRDSEHISTEPKGDSYMFLHALFFFQVEQSGNEVVLL